MSKVEVKTKALCDWSKKDLKERFDKLREIVEEPNYACIKCGRSACAKEWLCKPKRL